MLEFANRLRDFTFGSMMLRLCLAMVCGGVLGYGRSRKERPAGFRTYMLACVGATTAVLLSLYEYAMLHGGGWSNLDACVAYNGFTGNRKNNSR